jgi:hypothetical protein
MQSTEFKDRFNKMLLNLEAAYNIIKCYHLNEDKQIMLSDGDKPQKCRFCEKEFPDVTFKKISHAISHMVGNRVLKSDYECDTCNQIFSTYETEYSSYMNLYHTMFMVHGKGGIPKYKLSHKENSKIEIENDNTIKINIQEGEEPLIVWEEINKANNTIEIKGKRTYTPQNVLKALVKMALTIMPKNELQHLSNTKNWLMGHSCKGYILPVCLRFYRSPLPFTSVMILKKKDNIDTPLPNYVFCLAYRNIVIQMPMPMVDLDIQFKGKRFEFPLVPTPLDEYSRPFISTQIDLSGKEKVKGEVVSIDLKYESAVQTFPNTESTNINLTD